MKQLLALNFILLASFGYSQNSDLETIEKNIAAFSIALMDGDTVSLINAYAKDAKILPNGTNILERESLKEYWLKGIRNGQTYYYHKVSPIEIKVLGDHAYDFGYYEGESGKDDNRSKWKGKYVIVWKKLNDEWKIYLDIWNRAPISKN